MPKDELYGALGQIKSKIYANMRNQQGFVDCCKEFTFIRKFNTMNFNNKMNRLRITQLVLDDKYDYTGVLRDDIIGPIKQGVNIVFGIKGYTGSGKSELAFKIALISQAANKKYKNRDVKLHLCWEMPDFDKTLKILKKGDIIIKDEMPRTFGKGSSIERWAVDNILNTIRKKENTFIFVDPHKISVDICDLYLETAGMNLKTRTNRFMILNEDKQYFGHIYTTLHDDDELRTWYEREKDKFIEKNINLGGRFRANVIDIKLEQDESREQLDGLIKVIREMYNPTYKAHEKERNIHIWRLHKEQYKDKLIAKIFRVGITTVRRIYEDIDALL